MNSNRWTFEQVGLGYRCWNDNIQTELRLVHLKRSRGDLTGEIQVKTNIKDVKTQNDGLLHVAKLNVSSSTSRATLARLLEKRTPGQLNMDWFDGLEALCQGVILSEAAGESIDEVGNAPRREPGSNWMVEPLVLKGRPSLIFGPGGVGKSLIALACGLSVATHREIIPGVAPAMHANVLYLDWEETWDELNERIQGIAEGHGFKPEGMFYRQCRRPLADMAEELSMTVAEKNIGMIVVDSAAYAMGTQGEYGDANESVLRMHEGLRLIGVTSQIVDHVGNDGGRTGPGKARPYGSAYKTWAARMSWEARKAPSNGTMKTNLFHHKTNSTPPLESIGLELEWMHGAIRFRRTAITQDAEPAVEDTSDLIRELLIDGEEMTIGAIASALTTSLRKDNTVRTTVYRMTKRGELYKTERDGYKLPGGPIPFRPRGVDGH